MRGWLFLFHAPAFLSVSQCSMWNIQEQKGGEYMVNIYYMSIHGSGYKLSEHFTLREFQCHDGQDFIAVDPRLIELLENIRKRCGAPVIINSGYRTPSYNRTLKGSAAQSRHLFGMAADIKVKGYSPEQIAAIAGDYLGNSGGIGIYKTFTHVDVRTGSSRWKG